MSQYPELIKKAIREVSLDRLRSYAKNDALAVSAANPTSPVIGHWMGLILISGRACRISFKVHYMSNDVRALAAPVYGKTAANVTVDQAGDFVKEYCNLVAGAIKRIFEQNAIQAGISLPLVTRGFDEMFNPRPASAISFQDVWKLNDREHEVICSMVCEVLEEAPFHTIDASKLVDQGSSGEVDFL